jgi:RNA polymerase sigma factor (sigma-70 family)
MAQHDASDVELIAQCLAGNGPAWESLLSRYERLIYYTALRAGAGADEIEDIFQGVCLIWLKELGRLRAPSRLGAWLVTTTRRECWARWRSDRKRQDVVADLLAGQQPWSESADGLAAQAQDAHTMRQAVQALPEPCRRLLWLLFFDPARPSYEAVARELRVPANSIGPMRARCLSRLRVVLGDLGW